MNTASTHFVPPRRFEIYEPLNQIAMWEESFKNNGGMYTPNSIIIPANEKPDSLVLQIWLFVSDQFSHLNSETNAFFESLSSLRTLLLEQKELLTSLTKRLPHLDILIK